MANLWSVAFLAILGGVTCVIEINHLQDGDAHQHNPSFALEDNNDLVREQNHQAHNLNLAANVGQNRKFFKPFLRPFPYPIMHPVHHPQHEDTASEDFVEANDSEESYNDENIIPLEEVQLHEESQVVIEENQDEYLEQSDQEENIENDFLETELNEPINVQSRMESRKSYEVPCDFLTVPRYSCYTCYTYLVCKQNGGKVKSCSDPLEPYCNNGLCSANPSPECVKNSTISY